MFTGSVCAQAREWFKANYKAFAGRRVLSGCCGNFTIETVLCQAPELPGQIISNDISLYSSALGAFYVGQYPIKLGIRDPEYTWLEDYMGDALQAAATMVVLLEFAPYSRGKTAYHIRMMDNMTRNFKVYHRQACEKLTERKQVLRVHEYHAADVGDLLGRKERDDIFLSFMPTYSGGYERLYRFLDEVFDWPGRPAYTIMTPERKASILASLPESGSYVHVDDLRRPQLKLVAIVEGGHTRPVFIHSDLPEVKSQVYRRAKQKHTSPSVRILGADETVPGYEVTFVTLAANEFAWFRDQYLNKGITPADPQWRFGVCLGGALVGVLGWSRGYDGDSYYLMCDVAIGSGQYRRLSKLICLLANTREMGHVLRQQTGRFWTRFETTAFTTRAVSMKYRGVLEMTCRNQKEGKLTYEGGFTGTIKKAVAKWQKLESKATSSKHN